MERWNAPLFLIGCFFSVCVLGGEGDEGDEVREGERGCIHIFLQLICKGGGDIREREGYKGCGE